MIIRITLNKTMIFQISLTLFHLHKSLSFISMLIKCRLSTYKTGVSYILLDYASSLPLDPCMLEGLQLNPVLYKAKRAFALPHDKCPGTFTHDIIFLLKLLIVLIQSNPNIRVLQKGSR